MNSYKKITIVLPLALFYSHAPQAASITGINWYSGVASVAGESATPPDPAANDDVSGDSPNEIYVLQKHYTGIGPVDLVFDLVDDGGTTEYIVIEGVQNSTGVDWSNYHIELGFGYEAGFVKSLADDGLDFDSPDFNSTVDFNPGGFFFPTFTASEDDLLATGGTHPDGAYAGNFIFHVDVPDGISSFTIRQSPIAASSIVPVPAAAWLFGSALIGLIGIKRRK